MAVEVMQTYKVAKLFQTMAIVSLNMGNLNLEEKEKVVLQVELDKERDF